MVMQGLDYRFSDQVRRWQGSKSCWHYVSLPQASSDEIKTLAQHHQHRRRGWGAVRVTACIQDIHWQTSIFPAFDDGRYTLFLKAEIRKQAALAVGDTVSVHVQLIF